MSDSILIPLIVFGCGIVISFLMALLIRGAMFLIRKLIKD